MFKSLVAPILALLGALAMLVFSHHSVYKAGERAGVDSYHYVCYKGGPMFIQDEEDKSVVMCAPVKNPTPGT